MYLDKLTAEQSGALYAHFNTSEEMIKNDVQSLIQWIEAQQHLPNVKDEYFLANFLLQCKNSLETAKNTTEAYYIARATMEELFTNRDPSQPWLRSVTKVCCATPLPRLTPEGYRIVCFQIYEHSPADINKENVLKYLFMMFDLLMKDDRNCGLILIWDYKNMSSAFVAALVANANSFYTVLFKHLKIPLKKLYVVNSNPLSETITHVLRKLLPKKLSERVIVWNNDPKDLIQELPKETLPSEYDGSLKSVKELTDDFINYACEFQEWFRNEDAVKADLTKKPRDREVQSDVASFGTRGSFRKLRID